MSTESEHEFVLVSGHTKQHILCALYTSRHIAMYNNGQKAANIMIKQMTADQAIAEGWYTEDYLWLCPSCAREELRGPLDD